jgi:transcriptional regulator with XRE-family HTH domain
LGNRPIDLHVGLRPHQRRMAVGITQADLAEAVGLTFQQIQKYESGTNQIVSSRLYEVATALGVARDDERRRPAVLSKARAAVAGS